MSFIFPLAYLVSAVMFIQGIRRLSKVRTAKSGNNLSAMAMLIISAAHRQLFSIIPMSKLSARI